VRLLFRCRIDVCTDWIHVIITIGHNNNRRMTSTPYIILGIMMSTQTGYILWGRFRAFSGDAVVTDIHLLKEMR